MLPNDAKERKDIPIYSGCFKYFPDALVAVAQLSWIGNQQHNPDKPLHWDRSKSGDELDALMRHMMDDAHTDRDVDGVLHAVKMAWRALAYAQKKIESTKTGHGGQRKITKTEMSIVNEVLKKEGKIYNPKYSEDILTERPETD